MGRSCLVVQAVAIWSPDQHTSHLFGRVKVPHFLHHWGKLLPNGGVISIPGAQQHEQGALCAVADKAYGSGVFDNQKGLLKQSGYFRT